MGRYFLHDDIAGVPSLKYDKMLDRRQVHLMHTGKQRIVASHNGYVRRHPDPRLVKRVQDPEGYHIIQAYDSGDPHLFPEKLFRQVVSDLILRINVRYGKIDLLPCRLDDHITFQPCFLILLKKAFHPLGTLLLTRRQRRRDICHLPVPQFQQVLCHDAPKLGVIKLHSVYIHLLVLIIYDRHRHLLRQLLHKPHEAMTGIARVDDPQRPQIPHHLKIPFFHLKIPLGITHEHAESLLLRPQFDSLQQHDIIRIGQVRAEDHQ